MKEESLNIKNMSAVMTSMMILGEKRKSQNILIMSEKLKRKLPQRFLMKRMTTKMMMTRTCPNMIYGEMMKRQQKMSKMAKMILKLLSGKSPLPPLDLEVGPTQGTGQETRRRDPRDLGHRAPQAALVLQDPEVEVV